MTNKSEPREDASYAQARHAHERRKAIDQYKDQLEQGVQVGAELEKAHSAHGEEAQAETLGPIAAVLELLSGPDAADLADLSEAAAARHAELKSALTPERKTALRDLETGKGSTLATARIFRSAPQLLDVLPDTPLVQKVRELVQMLNAPDEWNGFLDPYWTIGQTVLRIATGDPWAVDQASSRSGSHGDTLGQVRAAVLIDLLNLPGEHVKAAADKLWERCLDGLMTANDRHNRAIPAIEWRHLKIALGTDNVPYVRRRGQSSIVPAYEDVVISRVEVLREFPSANDAESTLKHAYDGVEQPQEREARERRAKVIARIEQRLEAPALRHRTHCRVTEIVDDRVPDNNPQRRAEYFGAFELAVKAGLFDDGKRQQSQLFCADAASQAFMRLTKDSLAIYLGDATAKDANATAALKSVIAWKMDAAEYRARRLESLARHTWMPRRFIGRWLIDYNLLPLPSWLQDATPAASTDATHTEAAQSATVASPAKKTKRTKEQKFTDAVEAVRWVGKEWLRENRWLPNKEKHRRLVMSRLRDLHGDDHVLSDAVEKIIDEIDVVTSGASGSFT